MGAEAEAPDLLKLNFRFRFRCNIPLLGYAELMPVELKARSSAGKGLCPFSPCLIEIVCSGCVCVVVSHFLILSVVNWCWLTPCAKLNVNLTIPFLDRVLGYAQLLRNGLFMYFGSNHH